ncbi:FecR family protein [Parapedobacter sp. 10938]|uniref:FecR family protein n=1 Tax=Parapedobacter flavus TaxID=3110225 RepID=UPI002DBBFB86|nr:FecR domain-containing protein [Parapedobacter sp. 10938]MEC3879296.1 FecR domain-containing protein [Parapedobacter sp. 10938]
MDHANYTIDDFLTDDRFVNYCLRTDHADVAYWEGILASHPELNGRAREAEKWVQLMAVKVDDGEKQQQLTRLQAAMEVTADSAARQRVPIFTLTRGAKRWLAVAATLLLVGSAYLFVIRDHVVDRAITFALEQALPATVVQTATGERQQFTLPDGSTALLNGSSQLRVADDFNGAHRVVWLEGDAYFEVTKNAEKPFIVRTASTMTTALGTSFRVTNYTDQHQPQVMLTSGKVQVDHIVAGKSMASTILHPGQMTHVTADRPLTVDPFDPGDVTAWLARRLAFQGADFAEIKDKLYDAYGVSLTAAHEVAQTVAFTGQFANRPLQEVLDAIAFSNRVHFTMDGNQLRMTL